MYKDIIANIRTEFELQRTKEEIEILLNSLYKSDHNKFDMVLRNDVRKWFSDILINEIRRNKVDKEKYLRELEKKLDEARRVKLTISSEPTFNMITRISDWLKENVGDDVVVEFSYNPSVLAGAVVIYKGEYRDFTLKKKLDLYFETNGNQIFEKLS